jgi:hypothetical protein
MQTRFLLKRWPYKSSREHLRHWGTVEILRDALCYYVELVRNHLQCAVVLIVSEELVGATKLV